jgi:ABC-type branched-subunit amino acid transport system substrate-binding protein
VNLGTKARQLTGLAGLLAAVALTAGCGSSASVSGTTPAVNAAATSSAGAGGKSIVVGLTVPMNNNIQSVPEEIATGAAAANWVNNEQHGINGQKLVLKICQTAESNDSAVACANKLLQQHPAAVISGGDIGMVAGMPVFKKAAKVPVIGGAFDFPQETLGRPPIYRSVMVGFGLSVAPGIASYSVKTFHAKKVVLVSQERSKGIVGPYLNVPMKNLGGPPVDFVGVPPSASDLTSYFQAAASKNPDVVAVIGLPCLPALQAFRASGSNAKLLQPAQCADAATLKAEGAAANGSYYVYEQPVPAVNPDNPDVKVFVAALKKYAPNTPHATSDFGTSVFQGVMNVADLARKLPAGRVTAAGLQTLVRATKHQKNWLGLSGHYGCDPVPIPTYPGICSDEAQLAQLRSGKLVLAEPGYVDLAPTLR